VAEKRPSTSLEEGLYRHFNVGQSRCLALDSSVSHENLLPHSCLAAGVQDAFAWQLNRGHAPADGADGADLQWPGGSRSRNWRYRLRMVGLHSNGLAQFGEPMRKTAPAVQTRDWIDRRSGEVKRVPVGSIQALATTWARRACGVGTGHPGDVADGLGSLTARIGRLDASGCCSIGRETKI
jgi:hypothetical protein